MKKTSFALLIATWLVAPHVSMATHNPRQDNGAPRACADAICPDLQRNCRPLAHPPSTCLPLYLEIYRNACSTSDLDLDTTPNNCDNDLDGDGITDRDELANSPASDPTSADKDHDDYCDGPAPVCQGNGGTCAGDETDYILCHFSNDPCPENPQIDGATPADRFENCILLPEVETVTETVTEVVTERVTEVVTETVTEHVLFADPDVDRDQICDSMTINGSNLHPVTGEVLCNLAQPGDKIDNCPFLPNPGQENEDGDEMGDLCDPDPAAPLRDPEGPGTESPPDENPVPPPEDDRDSDGIPNNFETGFYGTDPDKADTDGDGLTDLDEIRGATYQNGAGPLDPDLDGDGKLDGQDNCPLVKNEGQEDTDSNGVGNACQDDLDGDGVSDGSDNCRFVSNKDQEDRDSDGTGDHCDRLPAGLGQSLSESKPAGGGGGCQLIRGSRS